MIFNFPDNCLQEQQRVSYCLAMLEKLRLLHNVMGRWFREGITENLYNKLPLKVRNRYPYKVGLLTSAQWNDFVNLHQEYTNAVSEKLGQAKKDCYNQTFWKPDIDTDIS